ncbi:hypothetical protein [Legionella sainthelensi]|uniref:hypothetical protein n=1 Tax=Legionella sainthelensi TaxID=28087 RepID=UPI001FD4090D|nr:hypothetical protein [Legionella sainthelensi]
MPKKLKNYSPILENKKIQEKLDAKLILANEWGEEQLKKAGTKDHLSAGIINAVKEAVLVQEKFSADMQHVKNLLITLSGNSSLNEKEQKIIDRYVEKIDNLVRLYDELNQSHPLITDKNTSPEEVIQRLNEKYNDPKFYEMMEQLASLEYDREKVNTVCKKYEDTLIRKNAVYNQARTTLDPNSSPNNPMRGTQTRDITTFTIMPAQNLPRVSMVIRAINDQLTRFRDADPAPDYHLDQQEPNTPNVAIESLFAQTAGCLERSGPKNSELQKKIGEKTVANQAEALYSKKESGSSVEQKQAFFLREILNLNLNAPNTNTGEARVKDFSAYLEAVLVQCYPDTFALNSKEELIIKGGVDNDRTKNIHKAVGSGLDEESSQIKLDPAQFDAKTLDELYKADKNALWLVLKSVKPIDENFTAQDKVQAYIELAQAYKAQKIGATDKYLGAYNMAQAAIEIAQKHPECQKLVHDAFGPKSELGQWIISKHSKKDQEKISENLSQYSHVQYIQSVEPPSHKKQVISPSQAMLLLIDHYKNDPEKVAELKKLYLVGVRIGQGDNKARKFEPNEEDLSKMNKYLSDPCLAAYEVSRDKKVINNDPTRRYFETHLAYETVKNQIDGIDKALLQKQVELLTAALTKNDPESKDAKDCMRVFSGDIHKEDSKLHKEYANYIAKIKSKELYGDLNDEQREKIILLVQSSLLGVANAQARPKELPIDIYKTAPLYSDNWKGKELVQDQDSTANAHMGLMKNYMPVGQHDIATSNSAAPPVKPSDQATYKDDGNYAKWVEMNFAGLVHPFSNAISGTMLCQLRNLAEQQNGERANASGITDSAAEMEKYSRVFIAAMLYGSGGHSLNEYTYPLQLDEVRTEFAGVDGFTELDLGTMFLDHNAKAFDDALNDAITYNAQFLQRQKLNQDIKFVGSFQDKVSLAKAINDISQKAEQYETSVGKMFFSSHRTASEKVDKIKPAIEEIIAELKTGNVKDALSMSEKLMNKLEQDYGKKGFTGGEKKSYQMAKEIHEILSELDGKFSKKDNIASANLSFKERLQQLRAPVIEPNENVQQIASENIVLSKPN